MDIALYRGRGAHFVLVHACMKPPRLAEKTHGPLRFIGVVSADGRILPDWGTFADAIERQAFALVDEVEAFRLLGRADLGGSTAPARARPSPSSSGRG